MAPYDESTYPTITVVCPACEDEMELEGWTAVDALWMHEQDCPALLFGFDLQAG
jgi:hypothetical protein